MREKGRKGRGGREKQRKKVFQSCRSHHGLLNLTCCCHLHGLYCCGRQHSHRHQNDMDTTNRDGSNSNDRATAYAPGRLELVVAVQEPELPHDPLRRVHVVLVRLKKVTQGRGGGGQRKPHPSVRQTNSNLPKHFEEADVVQPVKAENTPPTPSRRGPCSTSVTDA